MSDADAPPTDNAPNRGQEDDDNPTPGHPRQRSIADSPDERTHHEGHTHHEESDGRCVLIDTGHYKVQVWGDPEDSFDEVVEQAENAADRARADAIEMDDRLDEDGGEFQ